MRLHAYLHLLFKLKCPDGARERSRSPAVERRATGVLGDQSSSDFPFLACGRVREVPGSTVIWLRRCLSCQFDIWPFPVISPLRSLEASQKLVSWQRSGADHRGVRSEVWFTIGHLYAATGFTLCVFQYKMLNLHINGVGVVHLLGWVLHLLPHLLLSLACWLWLNGLAYWSWLDRLALVSSASVLLRILPDLRTLGESFHPGA